MQTIEDFFLLGVAPSSRILVCMPHPDDEAVFIAGILSKLSSLKIRTRVLTFSMGEKSTLRHGLDEKADLGGVRSIELKNALKVLGVEDFEILDFGDGNLENQEQGILPYLSKEIKRYKPTHMITLEPNGIYGHPDHIALSRFVTGIVGRSIRILYATVAPNFTPTQNASKMAKRKVSPAKPNFELRLTVKESLKKWRALKSHKSQFNFDIFHLPLFFLKNKMLTREYIIYNL